MGLTTTALLLLSRVSANRESLVLDHRCLLTLSISNCEYLPSATAIAISTGTFSLLPSKLHILQNSHYAH